MSRDTITREREAYQNARAAVQPFVQAWRALDSGLTDADREMFGKLLVAPRLERMRLERAIGGANLALCWAKCQIEEGASDALLEYPDAGVTFEEELSA
jgi:hypothetical protein